MMLIIPRTRPLSSLASLGPLLPLNVPLHLPTPATTSYPLNSHLWLNIDTHFMDIENNDKVQKAA